MLKQPEWILFLLTAGIIIGVFFSAVILGLKKARLITRIFLAALILVFCVFMSSVVLIGMGTFHRIPHLAGIAPLGFFLLGPFLFLYVKSLTAPAFVFRLKDMLHFIPFALNLIYQIPFFLKGTAAKIEYIDSYVNNPSEEYYVFVVLRMVHMAAYLVLTSFYLKRQSIDLYKTHSSLEAVRLSWLKVVTASLFVFTGVYCILNILAVTVTGLLIPCQWFFFIIEVMIVVFLGYKGLIQPEIFLDEDETKDQPKYIKSRLSEEDAKKYLDKLLRYMETEKPYLNSDLTISQLARKTTISSRYISQIINERLNKNFFDFINHYRIEEAKRTLISDDQENSTILEVAYDSGFNSKSSFNSAFKKNEGTTPSDFRKKNAADRKNPGRKAI